jgi:hypothetical protein
LKPRLALALAAATVAALVLAAAIFVGRDDSGGDAPTLRGELV